MSKPKRVEAWGVLTGETWTAPPSWFPHERAAREFFPPQTMRGDERLVHLVELPPGAVVVTREEARVLRYARMVAREAQESADGSVGASIDSLCAAVDALCATKGRKTR